tara:strand:+ start:2707 stop:3939 length:1233 start_codon:yes stop_codon:yes gene_type:complete
MLASSRFSFLQWPLVAFSDSVVRVPEDALLTDHLSKSRFSVRLLRYWWAAQAIRQEAKSRDTPLTIVDYGSGRGWLKRFVGNDVDAKWIAIDWNPETELLERAGYDEILHANFDHPLPIEPGSVDVVSSLHVFEHLPRPAFSLTQIEDVLAPGGCLLATTPTMPHFLASWRQAIFRRRLADGRISRGGHINCLSPSRWRDLAGDCGLTMEFITGSHLMRNTGNPLESLRSWIRFNQLWAALFPSLGSEVCLRARKPVAHEDLEKWNRQKLVKTKRRPEIAISIVTTVIALVVAAFLIVTNTSQAKARVDSILIKQLQMGAGHLLLIHHPLLENFEKHTNATIIASAADIPGALATLPQDTHIVLHEDHLEALMPSASNYVVDSRIDVDDDDFYLIRKGTNGTALDHFLSK